MTYTPGSAAIAGLGITPQLRTWQGDAATLAMRAIRLALDDAGLAKQDLDGLLVNAGASSEDANDPGSLGLGLQRALGLRNLRLLTHVNGEGSTAGQMVQWAALAVTAGLATTVACVFADAPLRPGTGAAAAYAGGEDRRGIAGLEAAYGFFGVNTGYAMHARRHMARYGTTSDQLGAVAVSTRKWAELNPLAIYRKPLALEDYHASRWVIEPFHLLDCTLVNNGGVAVIVTTAERARDLRQPPVYVHGMGQGHPGNPHRAGFENEIVTGAVTAKATAFPMAGITVDDIDICELYDCYTYTTLVTLEDYGFCKKGEGGDFVASGRLAPGGSLPTNTGGGQLSAYYMWGMTPLSEAVIQARGQAGERQVPKHDVVLVSTNGGTLDYHATLIVSPLAKLN